MATKSINVDKEEMEQIVKDYLSKLKTQNKDPEEMDHNQFVSLFAIQRRLEEEKIKASYEEILEILFPLLWGPKRVATFTVIPFNSERPADLSLFYIIKTSDNNGYTREVKVTKNVKKIPPYVWQEGDEVPTVHLLTEEKLGFTPADSECSEYEAKCGFKGQSWGMHSQGVKSSRTADCMEELPANVVLCTKCFSEEE